MGFLKYIHNANISTLFIDESMTWFSEEWFNLIKMFWAYIFFSLLRSFKITNKIDEVQFVLNKNISYWIVVF
jgi:hypothetical protein